VALLDGNTPPLPFGLAEIWVRSVGEGSYSGTGTDAWAANQRRLNRT